MEGTARIVPWERGLPARRWPGRTRSGSFLANNTVAVGYVELLADLLCVAIAHPWDAARGAHNTRRPAKYPAINLLAAVSWDARNLRSVDEFEALPVKVRGGWLEWLVAQELWRRAAIRGDPVPERLGYWQSKQHELDFVLAPGSFVEVERGRASPLDFAWFPHVFPDGVCSKKGGLETAFEKRGSARHRPRPLQLLLRDVLRPSA